MDLALVGNSVQNYIKLINRQNCKLLIWHFITSDYCNYFGVSIQPLMAHECHRSDNAVINYANIK